MDKRFWVWLTSVPSLVSDSEVTNEEQLLLENKVNSVQGKVFINDGTPGGTTKAYQNITTYPDGSMSILQKNLTTGEISLQKINPLGQRIFETSFTPYEANTLIGANSSSKMLVGNGAVSQSVISRVSYQTGNNSLVLYDKTPVPVATNGALVPPLTTNKALATVPLVTNGTVSQVASKVGQVQNNRLPYKPVLALPVKYPIKSESGVTIYKDYAIGLRGGKYVEAGITKENKIAYRNNGSYYVIGEGKDGFKNIPATDVTVNDLVSAPGGRKGNPTTRKQITDLVPILEKFNFKVTAGGTLPEEYMEPLNQVVKGDKNTTKGANYIDLTAIGKIGKRKVKLRINTVDTYKNGNLTNREVNAETSINLKIKKEGEGNPAIITIPKGEKIEVLEKKIEKIIEDTKTEIEKNEKGKK